MPNLQAIANAEGIDGKRASFAYLCVADDLIREIAEGGRKKYSSYVKKLPAYIKCNGLGQTLAFMFSKAGSSSEYALILEQFRQYFVFSGVIGQEVHTTEDLLESIISMDPASYRYATVELLSMIAWLRRFVEGVLGGETE